MIQSCLDILFKMPNPPSRGAGAGSIIPFASKKREIVLFSSTAIALYGYDQGRSIAIMLIGRLLRSPRNDVPHQYESVLSEDYADF